ncbi:STAS domain-containing protein [Methanoregula sp. UBA64]|jgi:anti-anti-sigma factor|uniref:STAS domain-containing protein n=1 Tax=Methanoregula sp. UBA64 TaxID=1915554 RepID=UPI0025F4D815|nr:STAS domain-containing protein [Methanoregula sp. UBA64]
MGLCGARTKNGIIIVSLPEHIDHVEALSLEKELREYVAREPKALLCDMSGTKYVSSSGLRVFLATGKMAKAAGVRYGFFGLTKFVDHIFLMSGFWSLFSLYDSEESAVRALSQ